MRILMLNYEFPPLGGGAANACYYMLKEFSKIPDIHIDLVTASQNGKFEIEQFSDNITIHKLKVHKKSLHYWKMSEMFHWSHRAIRYVYKLHRQHKYDICHCWFGWPSGLIGYLNRRKTPYIIALRGSDVPGYNPRLKWEDRFFFTPYSKVIWKNAKAVIANSQGLKDLASKTMNIPIDVIYNGIDLDEFRPPTKKTSHKRIRLISTGRLIERKGFKYLIQALEGLEDKFELTLIGEGDLEDELKALAKRLKVPVNFKGRVPHEKIVYELQQADIFVMPSLNEGMSNSILEAMACGLPIITTDTGGSKELINDNGFIIEKKSSSSIKKIFNKVCNENLVQKLSLKSREHAEMMSWENVTQRYQVIYDE